MELLWISFPAVFEWETGDLGNLVATTRASLPAQSVTSTESSDLTELCMAHHIAILHIHPKVDSPPWGCKVYDRRWLLRGVD